MPQSDTAIYRRVTKPKIYDEAIHFRAPKGTKARIDALRGKMRQGDFVRVLLEEGLRQREAESNIVQDGAHRD